MYPEFKAIDRYELIETQVSAAATRYNFADQPQLRTDYSQDVIIQGLETFTLTDIPQSPNAIATATAAQLKPAYLVLYVDGEESVYRIPAIKLHSVNNFADPFGAADLDAAGVVGFRNLMVDWTKSYFFYPTAPAPTFSLLLGVVYKKLPPGTMGKIKAAEYAGYCNLRVPAINQQ